MSFSIDPGRLAVADVVQAPSDGRSDSEHSHPEPDHHPQNPFVTLCYNLNMSSTPPTREGSAFDKKPVLSDQQRKANHTSSETKRRNRIKAWYWDLCQLVPDLKEKAPENCKRERVVLDRAREFARATMVKRNELIDALEAQGIDAERKFGLKMQQTLSTTIKNIFLIVGIPILVSIIVAFELGFFHTAKHANDTMTTKPSMHNLNVLSKPLALFSLSPPTGYHRDGYCRTSPSDTGNHAIAGILTKEFLDFSAARGNNLRQVPGLKEGCKWCLCTSRWKEAMEAREKGEVGEEGVPRVFLHATDKSALNNGVTMDVLKKYAAEPEAAGGGGSLERNAAPITPGEKHGIAKETH
ncbi:MAG: hypothetical protein Q9178_004430 [Gyalolechia marmorata]